MVYRPGFETKTSKKAGLFRSPNSLFELNAGIFLLRESAKFSVLQISGLTDFEVNREKSVCPRSGNGEKCRPFFAKSEPSRVLSSDLMIYARAFMLPI